MTNDPAGPPSGDDPQPPAYGAPPPAPSSGTPGEDPQPPAYGAPPPAYGAPPPAPSYGTPEQPPAPPQYGTPPPAYGAPQSGAPQYGTPQYGQPQYGAPQPGQPQYGAQPPYAPAGYGVPAATNQKVTTALVLGIVGIVTGWCCGVLGVGLGIGAVVLASQAERDGVQANVTAAKVVGWVSIGIGALALGGSLVFGIGGFLNP